MCGSGPVERYGSRQVAWYSWRLLADLSLHGRLTREVLSVEDGWESLSSTK